MRTLKKTLALVLVLAMMFSLCVTASADFSDAAEIENAKAVATLVNLGVIEGNPDGSFDPAGTLTRAQAAKIIACLMGVGEYAADGAATGFSDVPASHWASGYIAYCAEAGIVDGYGDGKFGPSDTLTGYAWTKMLLCALGYDAATEGLTGSAWQIGVAKKAVALDLWAGADADNKAGLSRDDACQYAYNILNQDAKQAKYLLGEFNGYTELGEFDKANLNVEVNEIEVTFDEEGRPLEAVEIYDYATKKTTTAYEGPMAAVLTYTAGVKADKVKKDLGLATKDFGKADLGWFEGQEAGKGVLVEVYEMDDEATEKVTEYYVNTVWTEVKVVAKADITKAKPATDTTEEVKASVKLTTVTVEYEDGTTKDYDVVVYTDAYEEKDVLLYNIGYDADEDEFVALNVAEAEAKTVKVTAKGTGYVKAGADKYEFAQGFDAALEIGGEYVLYVDQYGYVKAYDTVKAAETAETLVYVVDFYGKNIPAVPAEYDAYGQKIEGTGIAAYVETYAQGVGVDGKEISYLVAKGDAVVAGSTGLQAVAYDKDAKLYVLSEATTAKQITISKNAIADGNYYYNAADVISMIGTKDKLAISEGKLADLDGKTVWAAFEEVKGTSNYTVTKIFVWAAAPAVDNTQSYAIAVAKDATALEQSTITYKDAAGKDVTEYVYTFEVLINGEKTTIQTYVDTLARDFYSYSIDKHGIYVLTEIDGYEGKVLNLYGNYATFEGLDAKFTNYDISGIKVVDLTENGNGTIEVGEKVAFYAQLNADGKTYTVPCIYILESVVAE